YQFLGKSEPGDVFTGYKLIAGTPLWKEDLQSIKGTELKNGLASQLVTFLVELHSIPKEKTGTLLEAKDRNPRKVMFDLLDKIQNKLFPFIRRDARDEITQSFDTFLNAKA